MRCSRGVYSFFAFRRASGCLSVLELSLLLMMLVMLSMLCIN